MTTTPPVAMASALDTAWLEALYARWQREPESLSSSWQAFFQGFDLASCDKACVSGDRAQAQSRVIALIDTYRRQGHLGAWLDPIGARPVTLPGLAPESLGLTQADMDRRFDKGDLGGGGQATLREIAAQLHRTWCGTLGVELMHVQELEVRRWLLERIEGVEGRPSFSPERKLEILELLIDAEVFETFLHTRYRGQKRFSLEGAEAAIPGLHALMDAAPGLGVDELVLGMAHRGRLNALATLLDKSYAEIFSEFEGNFVSGQVYGNGDVRYHKGYSSDHFDREGRRLHISLTANPSHLEAVDPVVQGKARAKQRQRGDMVLRREVVPVLVHGDAAFAGQGIVAETLNLSQLEGYRTGGTVHLVIDNGLGFTASPEEARSSRYCTDVAKGIEAPVLHVNGDDPEVVVFAMELALAFRQTFGRDVVVGMHCYRRHGHNESDEPSYTQPILYRRIREHLPVRQRYSARLVSEGVIEPAAEEGLQSRLERRLATIHEEVLRGPHAEEQASFQGRWAGKGPPWPDEVQPTGAAPEVLAAVGRALSTVPDGLTLSAKFERQIARRADALAAGGPIDWAMAESLAWGALLEEGFGVRISGQDSVRGTFSQRHAAWVDERTGERYFPLKHIGLGRDAQGHDGDTVVGSDAAEVAQGPRKGKFCAYNSAVSEASVLGFEVGYSMAEPDMLIQWEAQFGDFANGAQPIIDQFISGAFSKWARSSGLVMLLPHGYEGQGPEHSNAYLERYLAACAELNLQVAQPSTPAQYFHVLRRQLLRPFRIPLVLMTPKGLLRHLACISSLDDLATGVFQEVLDDPAAPAEPERVVLCSGRLYYDLAARREAEGLTHKVALVRVEQFYPFPARQLDPLLTRWAGRPWIWAQDEPRNRGAWSFLRLAFLERFPERSLDYAGRSPSASPATGSLQAHQREQEALLRAALGLSPAPLEG